MIKVDDNSFELAKLAVTEEYKRFGIGNLLIEKCLAFADEKGSEKVFLFTEWNIPKEGTHL